MGCLQCCGRRGLRWRRRGGPTLPSTMGRRVGRWRPRLGGSGVATLRRGDVVRHGPGAAGPAPGCFAERRSRSRRCRWTGRGRCRAGRRCWNEWRGVPTSTRRPGTNWSSALRSAIDSRPAGSDRGCSGTQAARGKRLVRAAPVEPALRSAERRRDERDRLGDSLATCDLCRCPRLVEWREDVAATKVARHGTPCTGPTRCRASATPGTSAAGGPARPPDGANRTGQVFTGDNAGGSGEMLFAALYRAGYLPRSGRSAQRRMDRSMMATSLRSTAVRPGRANPLPPERDRLLPVLEARLHCVLGRR